MGLICLGDCGYERGTFVTKNAPKHVSFGRLYYDSSEHRATLLLQFIYTGQFICKPNMDEHPSPPYIKGDIQVQVGMDGSGNKIHRWCGFIYTETNETGGVLYIGVLKQIPIRSIAELAVLSLRDDPKKTTIRDGIWLSIWLEDHVKKGTT